MALDPKLWKPRFTVVYNYQERAVFDLRWLITGRLTRIDAITHRPIKDTWNKAGDLDRLSDGFKVGASRYIPWGSSYQVWPADGFYPFNLRWKPVSWFPQGKVQFWEYTGILSESDLLHYLQLDSSNPNADLIVQIESLMNSLMNIINPSATTTNTAIFDIKQDVTTAISFPANQNRNGGLIQNRGTKKLFISFGGVADKGSSLVVLPAGQISLQDGYVGAISLLWDDLDATPGNKSKATITEFVA
jgi:hypothetical protein